MTRTTGRRRLISASALTLAALLCSAGGVADDTALFSSRVPPNVMLLFDTSGSMNHVVWHPRFTPDVVYDPIGCPFVADETDPSYDPKCLEHPLCNINTGDTIRTSGTNQWQTDRYGTQSGGTATVCTNTREVFLDPTSLANGHYTFWEKDYLRWYFSDNVESDPEGDGLTIQQEIVATNNGFRSQCLIDEGESATYDLYRRSRLTAGKQIARDVICRTNKVADIRYGLARFDGNVAGYVSVPIDDYANNGSDLATGLTALTGTGNTPLGESLFNIYRYFQLRGSNEQALGVDGTTRFPAYDLEDDGSSGSNVPVSPVGSECQKHFVVVITDGAPTADEFNDLPAPVTQSYFQTNLIGDFHQPVPDETETSNGGRYLDDIAKFMHETDFLLTAAYPGMQVVDTYTVGFSTDAVANDLLERTAEQGDGEFYFSNNAEELTEALSNAINSILLKSQSFTSAAVPASRTTNGDNFYSSFFLPLDGDPFWEGHLKNFQFTSSGEILTSGGKCAIGANPNATPPCASGGPLRTTANAFWDAADEMPAPGSRKLYLEFGATPMFSQPDPFAMPATPALAAPWFNIVDNVDEFDPPYDTLSPNDPEDIASALIDVLTGCQFGGGSCTARQDASGNPRYLGDIFHSNPVVVGSPNAPINEPSYRAFANTNRERTRVIYAGANDGFLHAFNAGNWNSSATPPRHDRDSGEELFGFMPHGVRDVIKELPKQNGTLRTMVAVDGSPVAADAWFYRNVSGTALTTTDPLILSSSKIEAQWRTVLIGSLRDGGESYFALDVTDPPATAADPTTTYPRYLWGFPCDDCAAPQTANGDTAGEATYMGRTWSEPVITRVRVKSDSLTDPYGYERWVAIFGAGYHPHGDPNGSDYREPADAGFQPKGRALYMVDITTGKVLAKKHFDPAASSLASTSSPTRIGAQVGVKEMRYALASAPAVFDLDFDGFADVVYIGDLGGNLWKWVVSARGDDPINNPSQNDDMAQPNWPFLRIFRGGSSLEPTLPPEQRSTPLPYDDTVHYQSIFFPPTGVLKQGKLILAFGAGERANPNGPAAHYNDGVAANNNHYYVVRDADPLERIGAIPPDPIVDSVVEADLVDANTTIPSSCTAGFYITGRDAEKFITNSVIFLGTVFTGSFIPSDPSAPNQCDASGSAYLYQFDLDCGGGNLPGATEPEKRRKLIGTGVPSRPRVSVGGLNQGGGGGGCENKVVVITSDGSVANDCPGPIPSSGVNVRSWLQR